MKTATKFPRTVERVENTWIPMPDGVRLAGRLWLPADAEDDPVPALLEFIPYRKRDDERGKAESIHHYFAGHGYASIRVDLRGSGDSQGVLEDEYLEQEQQDGLAVLAWLAEQPWCTGRVGIFGISWGGFNGLQIAAHRPPELGAIITVCSTDDRYADDVHHMGGCLLGDNLSWASTMFSYNSLPPDPEIVGEAWRSMWLDRLTKSGLWLEKWLRHQRRDDYWKHGSVCENHADIEVPVYAVSGWADGYSNAVLRLLNHLDVPRKGLIGPWSHKYPHLGEPGPAIGFLQEALRWWDHWLKDRDTGITDEPMLRAWIQDSVPPTTRYSHRPGRWVAENAWPSGRDEPVCWSLDRGGRLVDAPETDPALALTIQSPMSVGLYAGKWCSYAAGPDLAYDQREEDGGALIFDSDVLTDSLEILGAPELEIELSSDRPQAMLAVRLSDVAPDDHATRVTYGLLNLSHRDSDEQPEPLEPGRRYRIRVRLNDIGQRFPAGHRVRLSLSTVYWPLAWPAPEPVQLTIHLAASRLVLPVRQPAPEDERLAPFDEPEAGPPGPHEQLEPEHHNWLVHRDLASFESTLEVINDTGTVHLGEIDLTVQTCAREWYTSIGSNPDTARGEALWERSLQREEWSIRTVTRTVLTCDRDHFYIAAELDAWEGDVRIFSWNWNEAVARDHI